MSFDLDRNKILILDGAMGTMLQKHGMTPGEIPELLNLTSPSLIRSIHASYADAGSNIVYANTFGANRRKLAGTGCSVAEIVSAAVAIAKEAVCGRASVALDIGPLGALLEPMGTLTFEEAYDMFREITEAGANAGADLIVIETMTDLYEAKAALLAAKESTSLPVFVTMSFDETGRTFTGCTVPSMARTLEGLGADAIGFNCSLGPDKLAPLVRELSSNTGLPIIVKPNAGLPDPIDGHYDMTPADFAAAVSSCIDLGAQFVGGCCGTSPEYIRALAAGTIGKAPAYRRYSASPLVCTPTVPLKIDGVRVIGERINPTGKKRFQQALFENDMDYIVGVAIAQQDAGADILDVNVGYPGIDEAEMLPRVIKAIQSAVSLPLQLDSSDPRALEAGLRIYNGKAAVNSVNGNKENLEKILPIVKKYGASVVGLCLDENGIPQSADGRVEIAKRIADAAKKYGIPAEDLWIDCLTLTVSAQQDQAAETLKAVSYVRSKMGLQTVLGVSNISFGLPNRGLVTQSFLTQAMFAGLTLPIINPNQREMMDAVAAFRVLSGEDKECRAYVERFAEAAQAVTPSVSTASVTIEDAIYKGLKTDAKQLAKLALESENPLDLVEKRLIPALDSVGEAYEKGVLFLPQLLSAAKAAQEVFEVIRAAVGEDGDSSVKKGTIALATVKGDIHDIGKNIVKTVLENYGYGVLDLGRDVPPAVIADAVQKHRIKLVGLSALMTTTLPSMKETVGMLKSLDLCPTVMVGGAVVTEEYAKMIGADYYAKDAKASAQIAKEVLG